MAARDRREYIVIEREVSSGVDDLNAPVTTWQKFTDCFCDMEARPGREREGADKIYSRSLFWFTTLSGEVEGVTTAMRIVHLEKTYEIVNVRPDYRRHGDVIIEAVAYDHTV